MDTSPYCSDALRRSLLYLSTVSRLSFKKLSKICQRFGVDPVELCIKGSEDLQALGFTQQQVTQLESAKQSKLLDRALTWHSPPKQQYILTIEDSLYPALLKEIAKPPLVLFIHGNIAVINEPQIAMVGSRNATNSSRRIALEIATELSKCGMVITSGLAMGIDASAHRGALAAGGITIGVLGCGIDVIYPKRNRALYQEIIDSNGLLISEFLPGTPPKPEYFPQRNRIVSGLSLGTLVVEAALRSGSLITARTALEQNREVFAIPGNINNPMASGCNYLIQQGAKLATSVADILEEFQHLNLNGWIDSNCDTKKSPNTPLATDTLLDSVEFDVTSLDVITERNQLSVQEVMAALLEYELRGLVASVPGGYIKLRGK